MIAKYGTAITHFVNGLIAAAVAAGWITLETAGAIAAAWNILAGAVTSGAKATVSPPSSMRGYAFLFAILVLGGSAFAEKAITTRADVAAEPYYKYPEFPCVGLSMKAIGVVTSDNRAVIYEGGRDALVHIGTDGFLSNEPGGYTKVKITPAARNVELSVPWSPDIELQCKIEGLGYGSVYSSPYKTGPAVWGYGPYGGIYGFPMGYDDRPRFSECIVRGSGKFLVGVN